MSLLMDALRKAEESKKKAEQGDNDSSNEGSAQASIGGKDASIPNVAVEFEVEEPVVDSPKTSTDSLASGADTEDSPESLAAFESAIETASLALESGLPSESEAASSATESGNESSRATELEPEEGPIDEPANSSSNDLITASTDQHEEKLDPGFQHEYIAETLNSNLDNSADNAAIEFESKKFEQAPVLDVKESKQESDTEQLFETPQPKGESISESTAKSRGTAKKVFSAKKPSKNKNRIILLSAAGIAAVLILGISFYISLSSSSSSGVLIPESQFDLASGPRFDNGSSGVIERTTEPVIDSNSGVELEVDDGVDASLLANAVVTEVDSRLQGQNNLVSTEAADSVQGQANSLIQSEEAGLLNGVNQLVENSATITLESGGLALPESTGGSTANSASIDSETAPESSVAGNRVDDESMPVNSDADLMPSTEVAEDQSLLLALEEPQVSPSELISFSRTAVVNTVSAKLEKAYFEYRQGNYSVAMADYEQALSEDPQSIDALLGVAAIATAQSNSQLALQSYSRVLALDPTHAVARSGLISLVPAGSTADHERELRRLSMEHPDLAPLAFVLANFYAQQSRWTDAQQNYFKALQLAKADQLNGAPVSPDYAFNLAVSLERLNQPVPARNYYEEALELAKSFPANFDSAIVRQRVEDLSGTQN